MSISRSFWVLALCAALRLTAQEPQRFQVKYVAQGVAYINGGHAAGLTEGMKLTVVRKDPEGKDRPIGELVVESLAEASAVCEIKNASTPVQPGDLALLSSTDSQSAQLLQKAAGSHYAQTITFPGDSDPMDEELRQTLPRPALPEINRIRGRIGFEYDGIRGGSGSASSSSEFGIVVRADITRIGGTYWNLSGYNRFVAVRSPQPTLGDLLDRTYQFGFTYAKPGSVWTLGIGRLYIPWAASLSSIDGGYAGMRVAKRITVGVFAGTTPDPTSWNYAPNREMAGTLVNFDGGSFEDLKYSSTVGLGVSRLSWLPDREFVFLENSVTWKRRFSVFHSLEVDRRHPTTEEPTASGTSVGRSFLTLRFEPSKFLSFDLNHNYLHDYPRFNPVLVGTGLLDKILFQGLSGGVRFSLPYRTSVYANLGRSKGNSDPSPTWNYLVGLGIADLRHTGFRTDVHYSRFNGSFGGGKYLSAVVGRQVGERLLGQIEAGQQTFASAFTSQSRARFVTGNLEWSFASHYFVTGGITVYRGQTQNYEQTLFTLGYRFSRP